MIRLFFALFALVLAGPALAEAVVPDPTADLAGYLSVLGQLWSGARWAPLIAVAVVGVVAAARRWGPGIWPWLATRYGGLSLAALTALVGSIAEALLYGGDVTGLQVVINAVLAAIGAIGVHSAIKNVAQGNTTAAVASSP